jgi:hypothetical protein
MGNSEEAHGRMELSVGSERAGTQAAAGERPQAPVPMGNARGDAKAAPSPNGDVTANSADRRVNRWTAYVELVYKLLAVLAIVIGGGWVLYTRAIQHENVWNINLSISSESFAYHEKARLVAIRVDLENHGKQPVLAARRGLDLAVVQLPRNIEPNNIVMRKDLNIEGANPIVQHLNMLRHYESSGDEKDFVPYEIEPGAKYQETEAIVASEGDTLLVRVRFWGTDDDFIQQYRIIHVD